MGFGMNLSKSLYELQQIDLELQKKQHLLDETERNLAESEALIKAKIQLTSIQSHLTEVETRQKDAEWEVEDLGNKVKRLKDKLYGGTVKNPKELVNLEHEMEILKKQLKEKEDCLLDLMAEAESTHDKFHQSSQSFKEIESKWGQEQKVLLGKQAQLKEQLTELNRRRDILFSQIDSPVAQLYEQVKSKKGQAVARVEQGRCQGCRITLAVSEWQRVRTGVIVHCSNCGRILHLE